MPIRLCRLAMLATLVATPAAAAWTATVSPDGRGDYRTVQQAIAAAPRRAAATIRVRPGTYDGPIVVSADLPNLTLLGDDSATTVLTWDRTMHDPRPPGADGFNPGLHVRADDFHAVHLTIRNTAGDHGQAVAARLDGDRAVLVDCRVEGWQDTLMVNAGRDYFDRCTIAGRVDFIFGSATAYFDRCEIRSRNGGHVTAASTPADRPFGFVFDRCRLTADPTPWDPATTDPTTTRRPRPTPLADLGRPWRPYASVTFIHCKMGAHLRPAGWDNWGHATNEATARFAEFDSTGPRGAAAGRVTWARQLTADQAAVVTPARVLAGADSWDPVAIARAMEPEDRK